MLIGALPFTFAHPAAVLPLARTRLVLSALVVGSMAPDFEYFLRVSPTGRFSHSLAGAFVFCLPAGLAVLWIFHRLLKEPLIFVLPSGIRWKLATARFNFGPPSRFATIAISMLVGVGTHLFWDSFTHPAYWAVRHWGFLKAALSISPFGTVQVYKILQHVSTLFGMAAVALFGWRRWSSMPEMSSARQKVSVNDTKARITLALLVGAAGCGAVLYGVIDGPPLSYSTAMAALTRTVVALISATWVALIVYGLIWHRVFASVREKSANVGA